MTTEITPPKKMTQVEYDIKIRALRAERKLLTAPLQAMLAMKEQEKSLINQQMDDLRKRSRQLGTEYLQICTQIQSINADIADRRKELHDTFWLQYQPKEYKAFNNSMAYRIRYSVLNSLRDALKPYCRIDDIAFDFNFEEDGNVTFKTTIPEICKTQSETE